MGDGLLIAFLAAIVGAWIGKTYSDRENAKRYQDGWLPLDLSPPKKIKQAVIVTSDKEKPTPQNTAIVYPDDLSYEEVDLSVFMGFSAREKLPASARQN